MNSLFQLRINPMTKPASAPRPSAAKASGRATQARKAKSDQTLPALDASLAGDTAAARDDVQHAAATGNRPCCPWHQLPAISYSTKGPFTYYKCPKEGCDFRTKVLRRVGLPRGI
jgi:hypothetical protein